jgi:large subunit ribosomal protein L28
MGQYLQKTPLKINAFQNIYPQKLAHKTKNAFLCSRLRNTNANPKLKKIEMSKVCQITGKKAMIGNNVSHSKRRTKRKFNVNLFKKKFYWVEQDCWIALTISAAALRTINKNGLDAAMRDASEKGYLRVQDIQVLN